MPPVWRHSFFSAILKGECDGHERKMMDEVERCFTYDPEGECRGASGRKMRQVCVYCPMMQNYYKQKEKREKDNVEKDN